MAEVVELRDEEFGCVEVRWMTRDPYRKDMVYEQSCGFRLEESERVKRAREKEGDVVGELCYMEGMMDGLDYRGLDWACSGIKLLEA